MWLVHDAHLFIVNSHYISIPSLQASSWAVGPNVMSLSIYLFIFLSVQLISSFLKYLIVNNFKKVLI